MSRCVNLGLAVTCSITPIRRDSRSARLVGEPRTDGPALRTRGSVIVSSWQSRSSTQRRVGIGRRGYRGRMAQSCLVLLAPSHNVDAIARFLIGLVGRGTFPMSQIADGHESCAFLFNDL